VYQQKKSRPVAVTPITQWVIGDGYDLSPWGAGRELATAEVVVDGNDTPIPASMLMAAASP
jgi:hypothetical protein